MSARLPSLLVALLLPLLLLPWWGERLDSDPPAYFSGQGQSFSTDPYIYTYHARNEALFGSSEPLADDRYKIFSPTLISQVARLLLGKDSVSIPEANRIGLGLTILAIMLVMVALSTRLLWWQLLLAGLPLLLSPALYQYARLPFLETGLLALAGATLLAISLLGGRHRWWIAGSLGIGLATVFGKTFGLLLLPALALTVWLTGEPRSLRYGLLSGISGIVFIIALAVIAYGNSLQAVATTISRIPPGWVTPSSYIDTFVSFGAANKLYVADPALLGAMLTVLLAVSLRIGWQASSLAKLNRVTIFAIAWTVCIWTGLVPLTYAPHRYALLLIPGLVAAWGLVFFAETEQSQAKRHWGNAVGVGCVGWIALVQAAYLFHFQFSPNAPLAAITWIAAPVAFGVGYLAYRNWNSLTGVAGRPLTILSLSIVVLLSTWQGWGTVAGQSKTAITTTRDASREIARLVGPQAVLSGNYATPLAMENSLPVVIYFLIDRDPFDSLLARFPITHLAINRDDATKLSGTLGTRSPIAAFWLRDYEVIVFEVASLSPHPVARQYQPTAYERAATAMNAGQLDSAATLLSTAPEELLSTRNGGLLYGALLRAQNRIEEASNQYQRIAALFPTDFSVQIECGNFLQIVGLLSGNQRLVALSQTYFEKATILNPYRAEFANQLFGENLKRFGGR